MSVLDFIKFDTTTILVIILVLALVYYLYTTYFDNVEEEFSNNESVRSDAGGDRPFEKLSLKEQLDYLEEKQNKLVSSSNAGYS